MTDKPMPMTKAEWEDYKRSMPFAPSALTATLDALFRYRERTSGMLDAYRLSDWYADTIAAEEGIE